MEAITQAKKQLTISASESRSNMPLSSPSILKSSPAEPFALDSWAQSVNTSSTKSYQPAQNSMENSFFNSNTDPWKTSTTSFAVPFSLPVVQPVPVAVTSYLPAPLIPTPSEVAPSSKFVPTGIFPLQVRAHQGENFEPSFSGLSNMGATGFANATPIYTGMGIATPPLSQASPSTPHAPGRSTLTNSTSSFPSFMPPPPTSTAAISFSTMPTSNSNVNNFEGSNFGSSAFTNNGYGLTPTFAGASNQTTGMGFPGSVGSYGYGVQNMQRMISSFCFGL